MTAAEIIKDLKARKFKPVYLLHGEEPYYIDQVVDYMERHLLNDAEKGFNQTVFYGKDAELSAIFNTAKRYPMMSDYQLVVVKEAQDLKWKSLDADTKEAAMMLKYFEQPMPSTILVLAYKYGTLDKRKKVYKSIAKSGVIFQSDPIRDYKLAQWIEDLVKEKGFKIASPAAALMAEYLGADLSKIVNELDKMLLNIHQDTTIDAALIQQHIGISKDFNVFELQKAIVMRDAYKCNQIAMYFGLNPKAHPMVMVLASLNSYFTKVLKYHALSNKNDAARELGVSPYFVKDYEAAARVYHSDKTRQVIGLLREYDLKSKGVDSTGNISDGELLKELLYKMIH